ncbi:MAG: single-stranded DNA-binding protein [Propionibacteriaceae bacterium]|nr:single-stranded DNA-binding protein [Propionibacteriaceae bacterium]
MQASMTVTGYVGHDIELRQTKTGVSTVNFRIGTTPRIKKDNEWLDGVTTWTSVVCYRNLADHVAKSLKKGQPVVVHGRVRTQTWNDAQDVQHDRTFVEAITVGHDLTKGVASFEKAVRPGSASEDSVVMLSPEPEDAADDEDIALAV